MTLPRLRQVALVAADLAAAEKTLRHALDLDDPFRDPGVGEFGLENVVFALGQSFLEVVSPKQDGTTAGRYLERRGDGGYMAIFQVPDMAEARRRVADLGVRVVWQADLPDIAGTHLHPKDVPGAIVSLDWADPEESWHWAGPAWRGGAPAGAAGGIVSITVESPDPGALAERWAAVLGVQATGDVVELDGGRQRLEFVPSGGAGGGEGIVAVHAQIPDGRARHATIGSAAITIS